MKAKTTKRPLTIAIPSAVLEFASIGLFLSGIGVIYLSMGSGSGGGTTLMRGVFFALAFFVPAILCFMAGRGLWQGKRQAWFLAMGLVVMDVGIALCVIAIPNLVILDYTYVGLVAKDVLVIFCLLTASARKFTKIGRVKTSG